jgi:hypothetical protein
MEKKIIHLHPKKTDEFKQRERDAMFSFYNNRRKEQIEYNPIGMFILLTVIGWLAVYGAFCVVRDGIWPLIKMLF